MSNRYSSLSAILVASLLWAAANVLWRFGDGNIVALAGQRALVGAIFFSPFIVIALRNGKLLDAIRNKTALLAMALAGLTMVSATTLLRTLDGPQAALIASLTPAAILLCTFFLRGFESRAIVAVLISVVAGSLAVLTGGITAFDRADIAAAIFFVAADTTALLVAEKARARHDATTLVVGGMIIGAIGCWSVVAITQPVDAIATSGLLVATAVGVLATIARVLRTHVLPRVGSAVANSGAQITALGTAVGGVIVFGDQLELLSGMFMLIAACSTLIAVSRADAKLS